ncbi:MAG: PHP domain-containing protein, partial [Pseudomonadales bacterium]|nr:PHP domain-containing protein [Pseudomonadales bacterium]
ASAITEHLEYQPHRADIPHPDRNRAWQDAVSAAQGHDLIVIAGSEITRQAPAGHMNAIFIDDANKLVNAKMPDDPADIRAYYESAASWPAQQAVEAANAQGAFVFWNHPYWTPDFRNGIPVIPEFHVDNAEKGLLHGIEIANGADYSAETFQIALDHNLTLMGVSDVHNLIDWDYEVHNGGHRPVTLVLAETRSADSIKEALFDRRTVVWFRNMLAGREAHLGPLLTASLSLDSAAYVAESDILLATISNHSDADLQLLNTGDVTFYRNADLIEIPAHETVQLGIKTGTRVDEINLEFDVLNALTAPGRPASITLTLDVAADDVTDI